MKRRVAWSVFFWNCALQYYVAATQFSKCFAQNKDLPGQKISVLLYLAINTLLRTPKKYHRRQTWHFGMKGLQIEKDVPRTYVVLHSFNPIGIDGRISYV